MGRAKDASKIRWTKAPGADSGAYCRVFSPGVGGSLKVVSLSHAVLGVTTHWLHGRTQPCITGDEPCVGCKGGVAKRWKGYLACYAVLKKELGLLELTAFAYRRCRELHEDNDLYRREISLQRIGAGSNGKIIATVSAEVVTWNLPPHGPDVQDTLLRIWFGELYRKEIKEMENRGPEAPNHLEERL
jgi:hypothetical protein